MATTLIWLGNVHGEKKEYQKALSNFLKAKDLHEQSGSLYELAFSYSNIGNVYLDFGNFPEALRNYKKALEIREKLNIEEGLAFTLERIASAYLRMKQPAMAVSYLESAERSARRSDLKNDLKSIYQSFSHAYADLRQFEKAYHYHVRYSEVNDSIINEESGKRIKELEAKYENDQKEKEIRLLNQEKELNEVQLSRQRNRFWFVVSGLSFVVCGLVFVFNRFRITRKQKRIIEEQKSKVDLAYEQLNEKNKELTDSIHYARRIQQALLTSQSYIARTLRKLNQVERGGK